MGERSFGFKPGLVRKIIAGEKTQTRRLVTPSTSIVDGQPTGPRAFMGLDFEAATVDPGPSPAGNAGPYLRVPSTEADTVHRVYPRWSVGERLWVRETFAFDDELEGLAPGEIGPIDRGPTWYRADDPPEPPLLRGRWRPSIHMPRWASRIDLEVTEVRVERLQAITEEDARAEGVEPGTRAGTLTRDGKIELTIVATFTARDTFRMLWDEINGKRSSWASDSWVWVVGFEVVEVRR